MLEHGGGVRKAAARYDIAQSEWLDLSTGLAPYVWPLPSIGADAWMRLPEDDDGLEQAARDYYGAPSLLPVAGSQAAIQALPRLFSGARIGILEPCYAEHRHAWEQAGFAPVGLAVDQVQKALPELDVLVVVNPNNPTGEIHGSECLLAWRDSLAVSGGCLIVDEAFADLHPRASLAAQSGSAGLIVLRSLGKFFGLGGARLGFVLGEASLLNSLRELLGPWTLSGPTRRVGIAALSDCGTQSLWRMRIGNDARRLQWLLEEQGLTVAGNAGLFCYVPYPRATGLHEYLARQGILTRLLVDPPALRFGLPGAESGWKRLEGALLAFNREHAECLP